MAVLVSNVWLALRTYRYIAMDTPIPQSSRMMPGDRSLDIQQERAAIKASIARPNPQSPATTALKAARR